MQIYNLHALLIPLVKIAPAGGKKRKGMERTCNGSVQTQAQIWPCLVVPDPGPLFFFKLFKYSFWYMAALVNK